MANELRRRNKASCDDSFLSRGMASLSDAMRSLIALSMPSTWMGAPKRVADGSRHSLKLRPALFRMDLEDASRPMISHLCPYAPTRFGLDLGFAKWGFDSNDDYNLRLHAFPMHHRGSTKSPLCKVEICKLANIGNLTRWSRINWSFAYSWRHDNFKRPLLILNVCWILNDRSGSYTGRNKTNWYLKLNTHYSVNLINL